MEHSIGLEWGYGVSIISGTDAWYRGKKKSGNKRDAKKYKTLKQETQRQLRKAYWSYIEDIVTPKMDKQEDTNRNILLPRFLLGYVFLYTFL
jgi:hypothetical protein